MKPREESASTQPGSAPGNRNHEGPMEHKPAVRVENLGKRYRLGLLHGRQHSIRDNLSGILKRVARGALNDKHSGPRSKTDELSMPAGDSIWALKDISLTIDEGEIFGIIGANGAGKSTLLKILARITKPTEGRAMMSGRVGSLLEVGTGFHPEMTGRENIFLNGSILGMRKREIARNLDQIVSFAELERFIDTPVKRYSSGMYVRLAFAVAAHMEPEILLVDEVLAVGDLAFQKKCIGKMQTVAGQGRTVVFVSHQMFAVRTLCDRVAWLDRGQIVELGPTFEVVKHYEENSLQALNDSAPVVIRSDEEIQKRTFYLQRLEMYDQIGNPVNVFSHGDRMSWVVEVGGTCKFDTYSLEFRIHKETGEYVATGVSCLMHDMYFSCHTRRVRIDLGPLTMTNGRYSVSLRLRTEMTIADSWEPAGVFHIIECNPFALRREIKTPVCVIDHRFSSADP